MQCSKLAALQLGALQPGALLATSYHQGRRVAHPSKAAIEPNCCRCAGRNGSGGGLPRYMI